jgi:hypothetical protein
MSGGTRTVVTTAASVPGRARRRWTWAVGTLLVASVLMFCYLRVAGATQVNSDGAGLAWQASDILHGNVLLHGWWDTDVSFYTTELPEYVAVTGVAGFRPEVVHICSALTYTLLVLLAAFVAKGRARGVEGAARALLAAGVILAPQPTGPTQVLLGSPDHVGTGAPVLLLLLILDRARPRWYIPVLAGVLLAVAIVGDPLIEVVGVLPVFLACLIRAARSLWRERADMVAPGAGPRPGLRGAAARGWSLAWYELSLAAAAALAVPAAKAANRLLVHLGGFHTATAWYGHLLSWRAISRELPVAWQSFLALFGADHASVHGTANVVFAQLHLIGVAVVIGAAGFAAWRLLRPRADDLIADVLVIAVAANVAAFLTVVPITNVYSAHEIGPVLALGAALAGRMLGGPVAAGWTRWQENGPRTPWARAGRALLPLMAAGLACYAMMLGVAAAHAQAAPRNVGLTAWLAKHQLTSGLAPYWEASSVTADSGGAVTVLTVEPGAHGHLTPRRWQNDVGLAAPARGRSAEFLILSPAESVRRADAVATFGEPSSVYRYGPYTIMVWRHDLLTAMAHPPAPSAKRPAGPVGRRTEAGTA